MLFEGRIETKRRSNLLRIWKGCVGLGFDTCTCVLVQVYGRERHSPYSTTDPRNDETTYCNASTIANAGAVSVPDPLMAYTIPSFTQIKAYSGE